MTHSTISRKKLTTTLAAGFAAAAFSPLVLSAPAQAREPLDPEAGGVQIAPVATSDSGTDWSQIGAGALGGVVLAGAGAAAVAGMRHHRHVAHPA